MSSFRIDGAYGVCGGTCDGGWYAGVLALEDFDLKAYLAGIPDNFAGRVERCAELQQTLEGQPRRILLVRSARAGSEPVELASAERIDGPACPKEHVADPVLAWTERNAGRWELKLYRDDSVHVVIRQKGILKNPCIAVTPRGLFLACERDDEAGSAQVIVLRPDGTEVLHVPGRNPGMVAVTGGVILLTEQCTRNDISLVLRLIAGSRTTAKAEIRQADYIFNADLAWSGSGDEVFIAAENCPAFGDGSQLGKHREITVWRYAVGEVAPFPAEGNNSLPVEKRCFKSIGPENLPAIRPQVIIDHAGKRSAADSMPGIPVIAFRQFRYRGFKTFGWDMFFCRLGGGGWRQPVRISECQMLPDTSACLLPVDGRYLGMFPAIEHDGEAGRTYGHRAEFREVTLDDGLPRFEIQASKVCPYSIPRGYADIVIEPAPLPALYPGRTLIWGDLHMHSSYSKCVAAADGSPGEKLRFARDSLGCKVFTLTEHTQELSCQEQAWCMDQLEKEAGDHGVVLYCSEPPFSPGRHTNVYAIDRTIYERLLAIVISHRGDRRLQYRHIHEELPAGSVFVVQHFHGDITGKDEMLASFDPQLEVAMEAMQGRCNALLEHDGGALPFPTAFLDMGCKIGLVGGTDHFRSGPNNFCLTGFWVRNVSAEGVWEAVRNRYTIAMSNSKISMAATLNGQPMGSSVAVGDQALVRIHLSVSCGRNVRRAALIKDGVTMPWVAVGACSAAIELTDPAPGPGRHWYVPTVEVETAFGDKSPGYGHTSPFFVMCGC